MNEIGLERKTVVTGATPLADKLQEHVRQTGSLTSGDIANFTREQSPEPRGQPSGSAMAETTVIEPDAKEELDPIVTEVAAVATPGQHISKLSAAVDDIDKLRQIREDNKRKIVVTPVDKEAFISAIVTDNRMVLTIKRCGDRIKVVVRSRTIPESQAILTYMQRQVVLGKLATQIDYTNHLRAALLAAQIKEFNGREYPTLQEPLKPIQDTVKNITTPTGWEDGLTHWLAMGEANHALLWSCVEEFEEKYWKMIEDAKDQNFWNPATST